ncbi:MULTISPECIES: 2-amino-4-hydroxy-6-hydroxymethyldihydropteridine diphosphokinase [unclassified Acinetobacter]|uniref:2-amino-4-hydroxy-6- hydroxymethyldihydropteridine diphosphokinase n=1 Tax=unclassified Acinetobacter TaxID=196816 RepID=UPI002934F640|nr:MULTISPECIES: 2-amino-4-hydroxy-6-hydroxymethyldihydropteridine diphosphokinase [unclassified Acinetobacter]WOE32389.1 2-amino-4-hydroxy-6-hydroxymethyldihydropteridine diphosphokinase [Acinetobacter sp. SAAs470]WOE37862.1 2-amino-4-hydroxy-6-hydroxymethyldihydropteridine diphosphokinase [Acinetobacter sp. SAAs474]
MNATETIFALALASNFKPQLNFDHAYVQLQSLGQVFFSKIYLIPCRDGVGEDYWNSACLLKSQRSVLQIMSDLKDLEQRSGRIRPSHKISLDIDLIAWGKDLTTMQFNPKKLPLPLDVQIPLSELWSHPDLSHQAHIYPVISFEEMLSLSS